MAMLRGGAYLVGCKPVFSTDGKLLLVGTGSSVTIFSVATSLVVNELEGHTDIVTGIVVVPAPNSSLCHVWTASRDGSIRLWNFSSGKQIKKIDVGSPVLSMVIPGLYKRGGTQILAFLIVWKSNKDWGGRVLMYDLRKGVPIPGSLAKVEHPCNLVIGQSGGLVGMVDHARGWLWQVPLKGIQSGKIVKYTILHHEGMSVLAIDPTDTVVAAGDNEGRIYIWRNVGERTFACTDAIKGPEKGINNGPDKLDRKRDDADSRTKYHWHAHEVACLTFTADGAYLLSGGQEAVLVMWQLESGKQQFLPRLGGPISYIADSPDPSKFSLSCADNSIKFLNIGSMKIEGMVQSIKPSMPPPESSKYKSNTRAVWEPQKGSIVVPTVNSVQFYDCRFDRHITEVQVIQRNYVSGSGDSKSSYSQSTVITHVTFSADGLDMATVDIRVPEENIGGACCLKFWKWDEESKQYTLNTRVDEPHSAEISSLAFSPTDYMVISCSYGGDFKIWSKGLRNWTCSSTGSYKQKELLAAAFSPDGSVLAVAAEDVITLWNPRTNGLLFTLVSEPSPQPISLLAFLHNSEHIVAASYGASPQLMVWNLATLSLWWSYHIEVDAIAADPAGPNFAITASRGSGGQVCIFCVDSPLPISVWNVRNGVGGALLFIPYQFSPLQRELAASANSSSSLLVLTKQREYIIFDPYNQVKMQLARIKTEDPVLLEGLSGFEQMYGKDTSGDKPHEDLVTTKKVKPWGDLLNGPSHVLPSLTKIGEKVLASFLQRNAE